MFEKEKEFKICKTKQIIFFGAWGFLSIDEKMYLVSHCHIKWCFGFGGKINVSI